MPVGLRFRVGDRVACKIENGIRGWGTGTVVVLHYREDDWPAGQVVPYQVQLDPRFGSGLIYAPQDLPQYIRAEHDMPQGTPAFPADGCAAAAQKTLADEFHAACSLPFVRSLRPAELFAVVEHQGVLYAPTAATGPWLLTAVISGPTGSAFDAEYKVNLKFNAAWPRSSPEVRFCSEIFHPFIEQDGVLDAEVLADLTRKVEQVCGLRSRLCVTLMAVYSALVSLKDLTEPGLRIATEEALEENRNRLQVIALYAPQRLTPRLFDTQRGWASEWLDPAFLGALQNGSAGAWHGILKMEAAEVYSFPMFTPSFCSAFINEVDRFAASGLPAARPNSMNRYGIILNRIGLEPMFDRLQQEMLLPLSSLLYPGIGSHFDQHHSFVVRYKFGEDLGLDMHTDDSEVTFNVCLGKDFTGAGLQFCGDRGTPQHRRASKVYQHRIGHCVMHLGHRRHGADDITSGERVNLIIWNRNHEYRATRQHTRFQEHSMETGYEVESGPPDQVCLSFTHDRDYGVFKSYSPKSLRHKGHGWCPPPHAEYAGFREESVF